jgi:hypothetical protein
VYSYDILLMETFIRMRLTDDMFAGEISLKVLGKGIITPFNN